MSVASSDGKDDGLPIDWSTLSFLSQDRKFKCEVRLTKIGAEGKHHVSLTDFLSIVGRLQTNAVAKAAYYVRTRLGSVLRCVRDVPLVPLTELLAVLRLLPLAIVQEYRENGDEQRFRDAVMTSAELPELLAQEAESWTVTGRMPAPSEGRLMLPQSGPRSPRSSTGSTPSLDRKVGPAAAWDQGFRWLHWAGVLGGKRILPHSATHFRYVREGALGRHVHGGREGGRRSR